MSHHNNRSFARFLVLSALLSFQMALFSPAYATSSNSGIDTPLGINNLPLSVEGDQMVNIQSTGGVTIGSGTSYAGTTSAPANGLIVEGNTGIGMTTPTAALDVNGAIHATGYTYPNGSPVQIEATNSCTPEGAMAYDTVNHQPVFCGQTLKWAPVNPSASGSWHNVKSSRSPGTVYTNANSYPIQVSAGGQSTNPAICVEGLYVSGIQVAYMGGSGGTDCWVAATVPAGATYELVILDGSYTYWNELY